MKSYVLICCVLADEADTNSSVDERGRADDLEVHGSDLFVVARTQKSGLHQERGH